MSLIYDTLYVSDLCYISEASVSDRCMHVNLISGVSSQNGSPFSGAAFTPLKRRETNLSSISFFDQYY